MQNTNNALKKALLTLLPLAFLVHYVESAVYSVSQGALSTRVLSRLQNDIDISQREFFIIDESSATEESLKFSSQAIKSFDETERQLKGKRSKSGPQGKSKTGGSKGPGRKRIRELQGSKGPSKSKDGKSKGDKKSKGQKHRAVRVLKANKGQGKSKGKSKGKAKTGGSKGPGQRRIRELQGSKGPSKSKGGKSKGDKKSKGQKHRAVRVLKANKGQGKSKGKAKTGGSKGPGRKHVRELKVNNN